VRFRSHIAGKRVPAASTRVCELGFLCMHVCTWPPALLACLAASLQGMQAGKECMTALLCLQDSRNCPWPCRQHRHRHIQYHGDCRGHHRTIPHWVRQCLHPITAASHHHSYFMKRIPSALCIRPFGCALYAPRYRWLLSGIQLLHVKICSCCMPGCCLTATRMRWP
jgi:hypothetical protein